nr:immunoglobulin heavy chain junction region [Macaca mulatta]MOY21567.1 immunoglobulin heavy chain junction region [Macaca mulatta]MOY23096.1 immunoglobulin heavy chain junction region [Macaca mulatta]MOY23458.1 immunoglobulin heavy chain junction region [Macaca mulatta]MOY24696.1 immunoglobulin heavy chain junction region [Macaca mulatta]
CARSAYSSGWTPYFDYW